MKKGILFLLFAVLISITAIFSCSDDDKNKLEGTKWKLDEINNDDDVDLEYVYFSSERIKTWMYNDYDECYWYFSNKYKIDGDELCFWDDDDEEWECGDVEFEIKNDRLYIYTEEDDTYEYKKSNFDSEDLDDERCDDEKVKKNDDFKSTKLSKIYFHKKSSK